MEENSLLPTFPVMSRMDTHEEEDTLSSLSSELTESSGGAAEKSVF